MQQRSACLPPSAAWQCAAPPAPAVSSGADTGSRAAAPLRSHQLPRPPGRAEGYVSHNRGPRNLAPSPLKIYHADFSGAMRHRRRTLFTLQCICCVLLHRDTNCSPGNEEFGTLPGDQNQLKIANKPNVHVSELQEKVRASLTCYFLTWF